VSAESTRLVGAPGWLLAAWVLAGLITITGALSCAELAAMMPAAGGQYIYLREAYGPGTAFVFGWSLLLVIQTATIAAVATAFANFAGVFSERVSSSVYIVQPVVFGKYALSLSTQQAFAIASIAFLTAVNTRGLAVGKTIQNWFTAMKTTGVGGADRRGLVFGWSAASAATASSWWNPWANGWTPEAAHPGLTVAGGLALALLLGRAMVGPLFAQSAWNNLTFLGQEVRDPERTLPRALLAGCGIVVGMYLLTEPGLRGDAAAGRDRARGQQPRGDGGDGGGAGTAGHAADGGRDHDLDLRRQQRADPRRGRGCRTRWRRTGCSSRARER
jgi:APA family basic amino acid/polyamine antiporter